MSDNTRRWIDLHLHSTASDGAHPPAMVVELSHVRGLSAIALTDHDTVAGLDEAQQAARRTGIDFIPGIELEATFRKKRLHLLGYFIDPSSETLTTSLTDMIRWRHERNEQIVAKLKSLGITLDYEAIRARHPNAAIGRPHIADELMRQHVVSGFQQAFTRYLGSDAPAYVPRRSLEADQAIDIIRRAGGVASLAHPSRVNCQSTLELSTLVSGLVDVGLGAIEVQHPDHSPEQSQLYAGLADRYRLAMTGGSDFHSLGRTISRGTGFAKLRVPEEWLHALRERAERREP